MVASKRKAKEVTRVKARRRRREEKTPSGSDPAFMSAPLLRDRALPAGAGLQSAITRQLLAIQGAHGNRYVQQVMKAPAEEDRTWKGGALPSPVKFDKKLDQYVAQWELLALPEEEAVLSTDEEVSEMARVQDQTLESNASNTKMSAKYRSVMLQARFVDIINSLHKELRASEAALAKRRAALKEANAELRAAKARLKSAESDEETDIAQQEADTAQAMVEMQELNIEVNVKHAAGLRSRISAGIANLRLHEKTHLDVSLEATRLANLELKREKDPDVRQRIVDEAFRIEGDVQGRMDALLNPSVVGSQEETDALSAWTTDVRKKPADRQDEEDYRSMLRTRFAASKGRGWTPPSAETEEVEGAEGELE